MSFNPRNLFLFVLLSGAAISTWILSREPSEPADSAVGGASMRDYSLVDAVLFGTDETGRILFRVFVDRAEKQPGDRFALDGIRVQYAPDSDIRWRLSAARGFAPEDLAFLDLDDDVRMIRTNDAGEDDAVIETRNVRLDASDQVARSEQAVVLRADRTVLGATGFQIDFGSDSLRLDSDVVLQTGR